MSSDIAVLAIAILHLAFLVLEMFLWTRPLGRKIFALNEEFARQSATLAANQGLYNGFLAAGLIWGQFFSRLPVDITVFFLLCVITAGIYGAMTVSRSILFVQAVPGILALAVVLSSS